VREFVFTVTYDRGADPIADIFIDYPGVISKSLTCTVTTDSIWYLDRITGPEDALQALDDVFLDPAHCNECLDAKHCQTSWEYEVLSRGTSSRTVYAYGTEADDCHSIPHLAATHIGEGLLYDTKRQGGQYTWRILMPDDATVGELYDAIQTELRDGLRLTLDHLSDPTHWGDDIVSLADVPYEQRELIKEAVARGYYETPREITTQELADDLELPQSTVQYRLARAEAWLATRFAKELD
jgi:predicted DNA binding protein